MVWSNFSGKKIREQFLIWGELARTPRDMGTICASSPFLARKMAASVPTWRLRGQILELGAGTGPVTQALLERGIPKKQLIVVEKSESLVCCLQKRFSDLKILCCSAEDIRNHIDLSVPVEAIVSSLPFRSLPQDLTQAIMNQIEALLAPGGLYIQFTYALLGEIPLLPATFRKVRSNLILLNLPPAKVDVFQKNRIPTREYNGNENTGA